MAYDSVPQSADNLASIAKYRATAANYDATTGPTWPIRMRCIALLGLRGAETVLDVGCGTGLSFEPLLQRVGRQGRLLAFEQSPEMHAQARRRADALVEQGWQVDLQCASAEDVVLAGRVDAALFHYVHDITRSPRAVANLFGQLPPGTRIAIAGMKFFPWPLAPLNLLAWLKNRPYNVRAHELHKPWSKIEPRLQGFRWHATQWGMGYIGSGYVAKDSP
jgi:demethylmenaquinone methyltransferase/2-methoxy-6-polyprenyl-1,4-benzoquinol methylase